LSNEEDRENCDQQERGNRVQGQLVEECEEDLLGIRGAVEHLAAFPAEGDGGATKDGEGQDQDGGRAGDRCQREFTDGAATGNPSNEHADEWGPGDPPSPVEGCPRALELEDRKSTRLNSSHVSISYAVFCLKKTIDQC